MPRRVDLGAAPATQRTSLLAGQQRERGRLTLSICSLSLLQVLAAAQEPWSDPWLDPVRLEGTVSIRTRHTPEEGVLQDLDREGHVVVWYDARNVRLLYTDAEGNGEFVQFDALASTARDEHEGGGSYRYLVRTGSRVLLNGRGTNQHDYPFFAMLGTAPFSAVWDAALKVALVDTVVIETTTDGVRLLEPTSAPRRVKTAGGGVSEVVIEGIGGVVARCSFSGFTPNAPWFPAEAGFVQYNPRTAEPIIESRFRTVSISPLNPGWEGEVEQSLSGFVEVPRSSFFDERSQEVRSLVDANRGSAGETIGVRDGAAGASGLAGAVRRPSTWVLAGLGALAIVVAWASRRRAVGTAGSRPRSREQRS